MATIKSQFEAAIQNEEQLKLTVKDFDRNQLIKDKQEQLKISEEQLNQ